VASREIPAAEASNIPIRIRNTVRYLKTRADLSPRGRRGKG